MSGEKVWQLISHQSEAWRDAEPQARSFEGRGPLVFSGSGSSYYLAQVAAEWALRLGLEARTVPSTEIVLEPETALRGEGHLVVISRSGTTTEALWALEKATGRPGWSTTAVSCHDESPLAQKAGHALISPSGEDHTVVMIQSFTSMLVLLQHSLEETVGQHLTGDLGQHLGDILDRTKPSLQDVAESPPRRLYILGSGVRYGIAEEGALKAQEMSNHPASAYAPLEFRHGPWGSVTPQDLVVILGQTRHRSLEFDLFQDLTSRTPRIAVVAQPEWWGGRDQRQAILLPESPDDRTQGPLALVPLQLIAWQWTVATGKDPDRPANITQVVRLDDR